jgi:mono/diheme cytochrome c family protein
MKKVISVLSIILIAGCAAKKTATTPQPTVIVTVSPEHAQGKMLYDQHCGTCHGLPAIASHSAEEWKVIVPRMTKQVNKKENNVLDVEAEDRILKYVLAMSTR